jgi:hypothetical protein
MPLDQAVLRYGIPSPHHLRLANPHSVEHVLAGATQTLDSASLKTIVFTLPADQSELLAARLATQKWYVTRHTPMTRGRAHVVLARATRATPLAAPAR